MGNAPAAPAVDTRHATDECVPRADLRMCSADADLACVGAEGAEVCVYVCRWVHVCVRTHLCV